MKRYSRISVLKVSVFLLLGLTLILFPVAGRQKVSSHNTPKEKLNLNSINLVENISGSYTVLDFVEDKNGGGIDLGRSLGERVIWEHTSYGFEDGKHQTVLYSFDPDNVQDVVSLALSSSEQEDYAGIRILEDRIMVKCRDGYYFLDNRLTLLGEKVSFPDTLKEELKRLAYPNGLYFNHFDVSKDGRYVYYTDEHEQSLFRYDLINQDKSTVPSEIDLTPHSDQVDAKRLPYRLYEILLTPNDKLAIAKVAGYMEAYEIFNLDDPGQSFWIEALPVDIHWSNVQDFIPMYKNLSPFKEGNSEKLDLVLLNLEDGSTTEVTMPVNQGTGIQLPYLDATFNKKSMAFIPLEPYKFTVSQEAQTTSLAQFNFETGEMSTPVKSGYQLSMIALLDDGRMILNYTSMYGEKKGYIMTSRKI